MWSAIGRQPCTLPGTSEEIGISPLYVNLKYVKIYPFMLGTKWINNYLKCIYYFRPPLETEDLCFDYSFWQRSSLRCKTNETDFRGRSHAIMCNRMSINISRTFSINRMNQDDCFTKGNKYFNCTKSNWCISKGMLT